MKELQKITISKDIQNKLQEAMPESVLKIKGSGKNSATYVKGSTVIDKLNATFGYAGWSWEIIKSWVQESEEKVTKVKYENGRKVNLPESDWIYEKQLPVAHVIGRLSVDFEREDGSIKTVTRMAPGAQPLVGGQSEQENMFKGAHTDALKKAATTFGIALELYRDDNEQMYFNDLCYENPWNDVELAKHKEGLEYLNKFIASYNLTQKDMDEYMNAYSKGALPTYDYLMPDNIDGFVNYIKDLISSNEKKEA